jgi:hypothetical protein
VQHVAMYHIAIEKLFYLTGQEIEYIMQSYQHYQMKCMNTLKSGPNLMKRPLRSIDFHTLLTGISYAWYFPKYLLL